MFCPNCGHKIPDDSVFCPYCGSRIGGTDDLSSDQPYGNAGSDVRNPDGFFNLNANDNNNTRRPAGDASQRRTSQVRKTGSEDKPVQNGYNGADGRNRNKVDRKDSYDGSDDQSRSKESRHGSYTGSDGQKAGKVDRQDRYAAPDGQKADKVDRQNRYAAPDGQKADKVDRQDRYAAPDGQKAGDNSYRTHAYTTSAGETDEAENAYGDDDSSFYDDLTSSDDSEVSGTSEKHSRKDYNDRGGFPLIPVIIVCIAALACGLIFGFIVLPNLTLSRTSSDGSSSEQTISAVSPTPTMTMTPTPTPTSTPTPTPTPLPTTAPSPIPTATPTPLPPTATPSPAPTATAAPAPAANTGDYILPNSSSAYITDADISGLTDEQIWLARNEIYARHGYMFDNADLQNYFNQKSWYHANPAYTKANSQDVWNIMNIYEQTNVNKLLAYEKAHHINGQ